MGRALEDFFLGRVSSYRLLDVEQCLAEFCPDRTAPTTIALLGCGPASELEALWQYFHQPIGIGLAVDACDWSSHVKPPTTFKQLDPRSDKEEVFALLRDETTFPADARVLVVVSCAVAAHYGGLLQDYAGELPPHAELLVLEPLGGLGTVSPAVPGECGRVCPWEGYVDWQGFVYRGGPRRRACFFSRQEIPGREAVAGS